MKRCELLVESGLAEPKRAAVGENGLRLGRSSSNDIHVPDEELSRNHCLFERSGEYGLKVTDLASANGTFVNGEPLGVDSVELGPGDVIRIGSTTVRVVPGDAPQENSVDLGLEPAPGQAPAGSAAATGARRRRAVLNALWVAVAVLLAGATFLVMSGDRLFAPGDVVARPAVEPPRRVLEMRYEKVDAGPESIYRYAMAVSEDCVLSVEVDDVPGENRHVKKSRRLDAKSLERLNAILLDPDLEALDPQYVGPDSEPPVLKSISLTAVYSDCVKSVAVVNTHQAPDAFTRLADKLETFAKSELGMWAVQMSVAQLRQIAAEKGELAARRWEDREAAYGNLYASVQAYREAIACLDTVNPKPPAFEAYRSGLDAAEKELAARCADQRIKADRAINLSDWDSARAELQILCQMIPDRDDPRNKEASDKLMEVESRIRKGGQR